MGEEGGGGGLRAILKRKRKKRVLNADRNEHSRLCQMVMGPALLQRLTVGGWRLVVGGWWGLAAVRDGWRLMVPAGCPLGLSLTKKKIWVRKHSPAAPAPPVLQLQLPSSLGHDRTRVPRRGGGGDRVLAPDRCGGTTAQ